MRYLCLIHAERTYEDMAEDEAVPLVREFRRFTEDLRASGQYLGSNRLLPAATATTVRVRNGRLSITDGPFAETKEQLGGYFLIEARDLNEAIQVASRIPAARHGAIEVRPVAAPIRLPGDPEPAAAEARARV